MPKRFRPRFSVRTLAIVVTLVCAYFGAWEATKQWGTPERTVQMTRNNSGYTVVRSISQRHPYSGAPSVVTASSPAPFVIHTQEFVALSETHVILVARYYLWLFGPKIKLPIQWKVE